MRRLFLLALLAQFMLAAPLTTAAAARTILVFGDSLSSGYGLPQDKTWVNLLAARLKQQRVDYTVANASISGETTLGGLKRINAVLAQHQPAILVLALGGNDGLRGQSIEAMRKNLEATIEACRKSKTQVVLVGMRLPPNFGSAYTTKFHETYQQLASHHRLPLVPFLLEGFAERPEWFQADGIHPGISAQPTMLETVWRTLQPLLTEKYKNK